MSGQKHKAPEPFPLSLSVAAIPIADDGSSEDGDDGKVGTVAKPLDDGDDDAVDAVVYPNEASGGSPLQEQQRQRRPGDIIDAVLQDRVTNHGTAAHMRNILQHHDETNNNNNDDDDDTFENSSAIEADDRNANLLFLRMVGESEEEDNSDGEGSLNEEELEAEVEILNNISNTIERLRRDNKRLRQEHEAIRRDCDELRRQILHDNRDSEDIAALRAAVAPRVQMPLRISHVVAPTNDDDDDEDEPKVAASTSAVSAVSTTQPVAGQAPDKERKASTTATGTETETRNSDDDGGDGDGDAPVGSVKPAHANR